MINLVSIVQIINILKSVFHFFKGIKDVFIRHNKDGSINTAGTFWTFFLMTGCFATTATLASLWYFVYHKDIYYKESQFVKFVEKESVKILKDCGSNSFLFWISFKELESLSFRDATSCISASKKEKCKIDKNLRFQNPDIYLAVHEIDLNTAELIKRIPNNNILIIRNDKASQDILDFLKETQEGAIIKADLRTYSQMQKYNTFADIIKRLNLPVDIMGITLVKDSANNTIYAFILSFAKDAALDCKYPFGHLQNLGVQVKKRL